MNPLPDSGTAHIDHLPAQQGYDRWAEIYDQENNPLIQLEEKHFDHWLGDVRGLTVADMGCGTGRHAIRLARAGAVVTAADFSEGMLAKARAKSCNISIQWIAHDLNDPWPMESGSYDRVVSGLVLEHIQNLNFFFRECRRICQSNGTILLSTMHPAMMLKGLSARFADANTGREIRPQSHAHQISDWVMAATGAGLHFVRMQEFSVDESLSHHCPRAEKYLGWPMLLLMLLKPAG